MLGSGFGIPSDGAAGASGCRTCAGFGEVVVMENPQDSSDQTIYCDLCCLQPNGKLMWPTGMLPAVAIVDGPTKGNGWAYMCKRHLQSSGSPKSKLNTRVNKLASKV